MKIDCVCIFGLAIQLAALFRRSLQKSLNHLRLSKLNRDFFDNHQTSTTILELLESRFVLNGLFCLSLESPIFSKILPQSVLMR